MTVTCVHIHVIDKHVNDFINATIENHKQSVKEMGNLRFDLIQKEDENTKFILYEAYQSEAEAAAHKNSQHYLKWRETVADWMAAPRKGLKYKVLALNK